MTIELHPDMKVLVEAKAHFPSTTDPATMRQNWRGYSALTNRPAPPDMQVEDVAYFCPGVGIDDHIPTRIYRRTAGRMLHGFLRARFSGAGAQAEFEAGCTFAAEQLHIGS